MNREAILKVAQYAKECAEDHTLYENSLFAQIANTLFREAGSEERAFAPFDKEVIYVNEGE